MANISPASGLSDAGGQYQTSYDNVPYVSSRGFTAPTDMPAPYTQDPSGGYITREANFTPSTPIGGGSGTGTIGGGGTGGNAGGDNAGGGSPFDKLLAALGGLGGASGGGGGSGALATPVLVQNSSGGSSMTRLLLFGVIGAGIWFVGRKQGWW